jgi:hypothetical protein
MSDFSITCTQEPAIDYINTLTANSGPSCGEVSFRNKSTLSNDLILQDVRGKLDLLTIEFNQTKSYKGRGEIENESKEQQRLFSSIEARYEKLSPKDLATEYLSLVKFVDHTQRVVGAISGQDIAEKELAEKFVNIVIALLRAEPTVLQALNKLEGEVSKRNLKVRHFNSEYPPLPSAQPGFRATWKVQEK